MVKLGESVMNTILEVMTAPENSKGLRFGDIVAYVRSQLPILALLPKSKATNYVKLALLKGVKKGRKPATKNSRNSSPKQRYVICKKCGKIRILKPHKVGRNSSKRNVSETKSVPKKKMRKNNVYIKRRSVPNSKKKRLTTSGSKPRRKNAKRCVSNTRKTRTIHKRRRSSRVRWGRHRKYFDEKSIRKTGSPPSLFPPPEDDNDAG